MLNNQLDCLVLYMCMHAAWPRFDDSATGSSGGVGGRVQHAQQMQHAQHSRVVHILLSGVVRYEICEETTCRDFGCCEHHQGSDAVPEPCNRMFVLIWTISYGSWC